MTRPWIASAIAVALAIVVGLGAAAYIYSRPSTQNGTPACQDPDSISSHIYNPNRLIILKTCIVVSGTVDRVLAEADGDYHLRLHLDSAYANLTNSANDAYQYGDLIVEVICARAVTQHNKTRLGPARTT